jgi:hypothetical protein
VYSGGKGLLIVKARVSREAFSNMSGLEVAQGAISMMLDLKKPFRANCMLSKGQLNNFLGAIESVSLYLFLTCYMP